MKRSPDVLVIDGQGGGLGRQLVQTLKKTMPDLPVYAAATNGTAAEAMRKAGADRAAAGENAVLVACRKADIIIGPIGIVIADSMFGEITPAMALAVSESGARKLLIPVSKCNIQVMGTVDKPMNDYIMEICEYLDEEE